MHPLSRADRLCLGIAALWIITAIVYTGVLYTVLGSAVPAEPVKEEVSMLTQIQQIALNLLAEYTTLPEAVQLAIVVLTLYALPRLCIALGFDLAWLAGKTGLTALTRLALAPLKAWWGRPGQGEVIDQLVRAQLAQASELAALKAVLVRVAVQPASSDVPPPDRAAARHFEASEVSGGSNRAERCIPGSRGVLVS